MKLRVLDVDLYVTDCATRMPFRFGMVTMSRAPLLTARVRIETGAGGSAQGFAADLLVPKWFEKDPAKSIDEDAAALIASARAAAAAMTAAGAAETVFGLWWRVYRECLAGTGEGLVRGFGVALLERAVMDGACRAAGVSFFEALRGDLLGFRPAEVHADLAGWDLAAGLAPEPATRVRLRHTVGLADPLRAREVAPRERVADGLPQALDEDVAAYGLDVFKIKITGERAGDLARLLEIARVFEEHVPGRATFTLDGNEQFDDLAQVVALLEETARHEEGRRLLEGLLYVEQPLARGVSLEPGPNAAMDALAAWAPTIIDEADAGVDSFPRAIDLGYRGISVKNCKGVFRALLNRGLCEVREGDLFQSAEDLTNLPVLALQQDLATVAALGLPHVERNGHHYFRGLDHLPADEARAALAAHPDLYREQDGWVRLDVRAGELALGSLQCTGYGYDVPIHLEERTPLEEWRGAPA